MKQEAALLLANGLEGWHSNTGLATREAAATELRRLHEVNQELLEALKDIQEWDVNTSTFPTTFRTIARAAIAKAGGAA